MLPPFILFTERLRSDKVGVDKRHFIGVFHRKIHVLGLPKRDLVIIGILQRHLVTPEMGEDVVTAIFPGAGGVEDVRQLIDQR
ncbi:hypothetical protein D3C75_1241920 [compost metagenome]